MHRTAGHLSPVSIAIRAIVSLVLIAIIEQVLKPPTESYLSPVAFGTLDAICRSRTEHVVIAVLDLSSLYKQLPGDNVTPSSALKSLLNVVTSEEWRKRLGVYSVGFDIDFSSRRPVSADIEVPIAMASDPQQMGRTRAVGTATYAEHQRFIRCALALCPNERSNPRIVLGVGPATMDPASAFELPETETESGISGKELKHLAGSVLTFADSRCMLESLREHRDGAQILPSLGAAMVAATNESQNSSLSQRVGEFVQHNIRRTPGIPDCDITTRYVSYMWMTHRDEATFTVSAVPRPSVNGEPQFECSLSDKSKDSLFSWIDRNEQASVASGHGRLPVMLLVGNVHTGNSDDEFALYHVGTTEVELDADDPQLAASELKHNRMTGDFVPGEFEAFPGVYQHAAYIDTAMNQPLHPMGDLLSKCLDYVIAVVVAIIMFLIEVRVEVENDESAEDNARRQIDRYWIEFNLIDGIIAILQRNRAIDWTYRIVERWRQPRSENEILVEYLYRVGLSLLLIGPLVAILVVKGLPPMPNSIFNFLVYLFIGSHILHLGWTKITSALNARLVLSASRLGLAAWLFAFSIMLGHGGIFWLGYITAIIFILVEPYVVTPIEEALKIVNRHFSTAQG